VEVAIDPVLVVNDMNFVHHAVRAGAGIGPLPEMLAGPDLVRVLPEWSFAAASLSLVWPAARSLSPRVRAFLDFMPRLFGPGRCPGGGGGG